LVASTDAQHVDRRFVLVNPKERSVVTESQPPLRRSDAFELYNVAVTGGRKE
jgi:hypothetical protein